LSTNANHGIGIADADAGGRAVVLVNSPGILDVNRILRTLSTQLPLDPAAVDISHVGEKFYKGQRVQIKPVSIQAAQRLFRSTAKTCHWIPSMSDMLGKFGVIADVGPDISVEVETSSIGFWWHPELLEGLLMV